MKGFLMFLFKHFFISVFADTISVTGGGDPDPYLDDIRVPTSSSTTTRSYKKDPLQKYRFSILIEGMTDSDALGFQKISGLTQEVDVVEYSEGGYSMGYSHKLPGKPKLGELSCERGVYAGDSSFLRCFLNTVDATLDTEYRFNLTIVHKNRFGTPIHTYTLKNAWVSKWEGTDLDSTSGDVAIEKMTIQYESMSVNTRRLS